MNRWLVYVLGIITGIVLTFVFAYFYNISNQSGIRGLELFEESGENMGYSKLEVIQVIESGCALAQADRTFDATVLIIPEEGQHFYDNQKIDIGNSQCVQRVGTYKYTTKGGLDKTVPAVKIIGGRENTETIDPGAPARVSGITLFDEPGDCVSRKNFEVQEVLPSGDAIALEIRDSTGGYIFTSDLKVLILAEKDSHFYNNQIVRAPRGKCARQIGIYRYYGDVIPVVAFK